jgi:RsmE family RNA methyltransferase
VNLLLVEPGEIQDGQVVLDDRRADHLREVVGVQIGSRVKVGQIGGLVGSGEVVADDGEELTLRLTLDDTPPPPMPVEVILAVPRPKVLTRTVESLAAFGVRRITLTNAWRVDKSYLDSPRLDPDALAAAVRLGAEQGATTHLPEVALHRRLMELLDRFPAPGVHLVAHPGAPPIESALPGAETLAIGPEGGWIAREVDTFVERGFTPVSLGPAILRVETAVAAALGQLGLLARIRQGG